MQEQDVIIDLAMEPRSVPSAHGWQWIVQAFQLFRSSPTIWIGISGLFFAIMVVISLLPVLGGLIGTIIGPILLGGLMVAAQTSAQGQTPKLMDLFIGFRQRTIDLMKVGVLYLLGTMTLVILVTGLLVLLQYLGLTLPKQEEINSLEQLNQWWPLGLLILACFSVVYSAYFFAPALVMLGEMSAAEAMKMSFLAFWRNWAAILVLSVLGGVLMFIAMLPFFIGLIVALPVALLASYVCYVDIFAPHSVGEQQ